MNYLAHLYFADKTAESLIGNLLGDFVKGNVAKAQYNLVIQSGIEMHRKIDAYTDAHEIVRNAKRIISPVRRRFAGILVDLFFDHFLARRWNEFHTMRLEEFTQWAYQVLQQTNISLPDRLQYVLPFMIKEDWLTSYREIDSVGQAINGISRRLRRENTLAGGIEELIANYDEFEAVFQSFFPELIEFVKTQK